MYLEGINSSPVLQLDRIPIPHVESVSTVGPISTVGPTSTVGPLLPFLISILL